MNRKKAADREPQTIRPADRAKAPHDHGELSRLRRKMAITAGLFALSVAVAAVLFADWYYGLPDDATAEFVGRQSCVQCHEAQHSAWTGSHHDLAMDVAKEMTVLGDFK